MSIREGRLTNQCMYRFLSLPLKFTQLLLELTLEIPIRPFRSNVKNILVQKLYWGVSWDKDHTQVLGLSAAHRQ